jgi:hypothetical protein
MAEVQIVNLNEYRSTYSSGSDTEGTVRFRREAKARTDSDLPAARSARETDFADLYGADTAAGGLIVRARELLASMAFHAAAAQACLAADELMDADQEINLIQADLPELFCLRELSEGLATVTVALSYALQNRRDGVLDDDQVYAVRHCIEQLQEHPFLSFDAGLTFVDQLVAAGLVTDPPEAKILGEVFASE